MLLMAIVGGLSYGNIDLNIGDTQEEPNEGIWRSLKNSLRLATGSGVSLSAIIGSIIYILTNPFNGIIAGLFFFFAGFFPGIVVGGGFPVVQHFVLRVLLYFRENVPLNYPKLLNHAVYHIFLLRVGGGYIFIHRLLLDYLASRKPNV
jgi:hypothetical protein